MGRNADFLAERLANGGMTIGQVRVEPGYSLSHRDDAGRGGVKVFTDPHEAIVLARYDDDGLYRPLKTAPNLAHGWRFELSTVEEVLLTLDFLYPAAIGTALAAESGELQPINLRETLGRQTGMYAVTKKITDEQAEKLIGDFCHTGCLRKILWPISPGIPAPADAQHSEGSAIPLRCAEACNLLVAEARKVVKADV
jgi:sirohydrochlorin cobaltochelatase